ncbi:O-antigen ligase family protein [Tessaracoccus flavus]|uniref:O-antigen ligase-related domain-containing protein n=1 Tax=Tessaracoccus flavus TaxID=1610493 RepID=A0A1Q2CIA5_9ACTN|nr:O-antigen ligase family protein [Tessaracoccus flavus]AQP45785.1 hypothetical protein RPIT_14050 [Tessaracoccus flavus]SDZ20864.1 O-Antigen ligase [Tessaracoccus flavus]
MKVHLSFIDRAGIVLLGLWGTWVVASAISHESAFADALPYLTAPTFGALGVAAGRLLQTRGIPRWFAASLLALSVYVLAGVTVLGRASSPLGYANANAALAVQLSAVAAITALSVRGQARSWAIWAAALFAVAVPWTLSRAGLVLLIAYLVAVAVATIGPAKRRPWVIPASALMVVAAGATVMHAARMSEWPPAYTQAFSSARRQLWSEALGLWAKHPVTGGGPGSFRAIGGLTLDSDTERVHMSVLQVGSELGIIGVILFATFVLLAFVQLVPAEPRSRLLGAAAVAALFIHTFVDHLLEFPAIPLAMGMVVGLASHSRSGVNRA